MQQAKCTRLVLGVAYPLRSCHLEQPQLHNTANLKRTLKRILTYSNAGTHMRKTDSTVCQASGCGGG